MWRRHRTQYAYEALAGELAEQEFLLKEQLIDARRSAGMSQAAVARELGLNKSAVSRFERLDSNPTLSLIRHYAHTVGALVTFDVKRNWTPTHSTVVTRNPADSEWQVPAPASTFTTVGTVTCA